MWDGRTTYMVEHGYASVHSLCSWVSAGVLSYIRFQFGEQVLVTSRSLDGVHVRPAERAAAEQHVADERLNRRLADQSHEEHLLDDLRRHGPQRRQPQEQFSESRRLTRVLRTNVVFERALRLLLQAFDVRSVAQTTRIYKTRKQNML